MAMRSGERDSGRLVACRFGSRLFWIFVVPCFDLFLILELSVSGVYRGLNALLARMGYLGMVWRTLYK